MTIRFINGLFGDSIPLDAPVEWLDKESINDKHSAIIADFYPRIDGKMYSIEIEESDRGDMAIRVFKYTVGGAMLHNMTSAGAELSITFPQPCVVFLKSTGNTPQKLTWNVKFFDGQKVTLQIPTIRLAELSVKEIAERNLFPIGQFYLLQETIRKTTENTIIKSEQECGFVMTTNIMETLPWIDYREVFAKIEERGKTEGIAAGKTESQMDIAAKAFARLGRGKNQNEISQILKDLEIPEHIINAAKIEADRDRQPKKRSEPERER